MLRKRFWLVAVAIGMVLLFSGCASDGIGMEDEGDKKQEKLEKQSSKKNDEKFKEADKVAHEFMVAFIDRNNPVIFSLLSPKGLEMAKEETAELFLDKVEDEGNFEKLDGNYELRRYDNYYDDADGELCYFVHAKNYIGKFYIVMKQNNEGEWKVKEEFSERPDYVVDRESGTILHEMPEEEEDDEYGFE